MRSDVPHSRLLSTCLPGSPAGARRGGFTLIQLIVAIVLICAMAGLLFPAFRHGIEVSRQSRCAAQLRQIHFAMTSYAQENRGRFSPYLVTATGKAHQYWVARMRPYFSLPVTQLWADNEPSEVYRCPSDRRPVGSYSSDAGKNGSYGLCGLNGLAWGVWAYPDGTKPSAWRDGLIATSVREPSKTAMLFDHELVYASTPDHLRASSHAFRHRGMINVVYFDGHIGTLTKEQIPDAMNIFWRIDAPADLP